MKRFRRASLHIEDLDEGNCSQNIVCDMIEFKKGKGSAPAPTPMIAPAPPVEEASVELSDREKIKAQTKKSELRMPVANALNTGIKMAQLKKKANGNV